MNPDGLSYLQMAARCADGDSSALLNSDGSPGYGALLAILLALFRPAPQTAFGVTHLLNHLISTAAIATFTYFLSHAAGQCRF